MGEHNTMALPNSVEQLIAPTIKAMGFEIVRVQLLGQQSKQLQIMVEHLDDKPMQIDECANISRAIAAILDVEDPISGAYTLEVSSPGLERPLVRLGDYERFAGFDAKVETTHAVGTQRRFKGKILGIKEEIVLLKVMEDTIELPFHDIRRAKLVLTDELIAATH